MNLKLLATLALVIVSLAWSYGWIVMKQALQYAGPIDFVALRNVGGAVVLIFFLMLSGHSLRPPPILPTIAIGLSQIVGFQGLSQIALLNGGAGKTSLLAYTMPFWAIILYWLFLKEKNTLFQWIAVAFAGVGLIFIIQPWEELGTLRSTAIAVASGFCWAVGVVFSRSLFNTSNISVMSLTTWQQIFGALAIAIVALAVPQQQIDWSLEFIYDLMYVTIVATSLAWVLWLFVVKVLPTAISSLTSLVVPVAVVVLAWLFLHENPTVFELIGMFFIGIGLIVVSGIIPFLFSLINKNQ